MNLPGIGDRSPRMGKSHVWSNGPPRQEAKSPMVEKMLRRITKSTNSKQEWAISTNVNDKGIPDYYAEDDSFCSYTDTKSFRDSPYYKLNLGKKARENSGVLLKSHDFLDVAEDQVDPLDFYQSGLDYLEIFPETEGPVDKSKKRPRILSWHGAAELYEERRNQFRSGAGMAEMQVMKLIFLREGLLDVLEKTVKNSRRKIRDGISGLHWDNVAVDAHMHAAALSILPIIEALRLRTVQIIEAVEDWRIARQKSNESETFSSEVQPMEELKWMNCNYMLKITVDTSFLTENIARSRKSLLQVLGLAVSRNPLFTTISLEELALQKRNSKGGREAAFPIAIQRESVTTEQTNKNGSADSLILSESRIISAACALLAEENSFGRIAPLEYDVYKTSMEQGSHALLERRGSRDDLDWTLGKNNPVHTNTSRVSNGTNMVNNHEYEHRKTTPPRTTSSTSSRTRPGSASFILTLGRDRSIGEALRKNIDFLSIGVHHLSQIRDQPSELTQGILGALRVLLLNPREPIPPPSEFQWNRLVEHLLSDEHILMQQLAAFDGSKSITVSKAKFLRPIFKDPRFDPSRIRLHSEPAALLCSWCLIHASRYVLNLESCFDFQAGAPAEQTVFNIAIQDLRKEVQELKSSMEHGHFKSTHTNLTALELENMFRGDPRWSGAFRLQPGRKVFVKASLDDSRKIMHILLHIRGPNPQQQAIHSVDLDISRLRAWIYLQDECISSESEMDQNSWWSDVFNRSTFTRLLNCCLGPSNTFHFKAEINATHPLDGFEVGGLRMFVRTSVEKDGTIILKALELRGTQNINSPVVQNENAFQLEAQFSPSQYENFGYPSLPDLLQKLSLEPDQDGNLHFEIEEEIWSKEGFYLSGHKVDSCIVATPTALKIKVFAGSSNEDDRFCIERETSLVELASNMFPQPSSVADLREGLNFDAAIKSMMILPWPPSPTGFRLEFSNWKEEGLPINVEFNGEKVGDIVVGPRSTFYDARLQIESAHFGALEDLKFMFDECTSKSDEVSSLPLVAAYPTISLYAVDEYSDEDQSSDSEDSEGDGKGKASRSKSKISKKGKKRGKRKKRSKREGYLFKLSKSKKNAVPEMEESKEDLEALEKQRLLEEQERKRKESVFFEELERMPGTVSVSTGDLSLTSSVDLLGLIERGCTLEVEGIRCVVSKDKKDVFNPCAVPLSQPFNESRDSHDGVQKECKEEPEIKKPNSTAQEEAKASFQNIPLFKVIKIPAKASELKNVTVSVEAGSTEVKTSDDLRYKLKPGDIIRINETVVVNLVSDPVAPFESDRLTLSKPYGGESGENFKIEKVTLIEQSEKDKQKSMAQRERDKQEEKIRKQQQEEALKRVESFFGYKVGWKYLLPLLGSGILHMKQQDFWDRVTLDFAIREVYKLVCKQWFPPSEGLDNVKWLKLLKQLPNISKDHLNTTDIDLIFAKSTSQGERRLTRTEFTKVALPQVAVKLYPWLDQDMAYRKFLNDVIFEWPETQRLMWREAQRLAVVEEARRHCASLKMQAFSRGRACRFMFLKKQKATLILQKQLKSFHHRNQFKKVVEVYRQAKEIKNAEKVSKRKALKGARLYCRCRLIGGIRNIVSVLLHSKGSILITCYNPIDCVVYKFTVLLDQIRQIVEESLSVANLTDAELYEEKNLEYVLLRLQYRARVGTKAIVLGRKPNMEAGNKLLVQGVYIKCSDKSKVLHIVTVTEARSEYTFHAYNPETGSVKAVILTNKKLYSWFGFDESQDKQSVPDLLRPENLPQLLQWLVVRLLLCKACALNTHYLMHKRCEDVLMLEYDIAEQREINMACKIQGMWRRRQSRKIIYSLISRAYRKQFDATSRRWYYVRFDTGVVSWERPKLLGSWDLPDPPDRWEATYDQNGNKYFYHPLTGRSSWLSEHDAAQRMQRMYRKRDAKNFIVPLPELVKTLTFQRASEANYEKTPERLSAMVNYALLIHTRDFKYKEAKKLYEQAMELAPNSPLVLLSLSIVELAMNQYPRNKTFQDATNRIEKGRKNDPTLEKFTPAFRSFYFFAVVSQPRHAQAWLNYALVNQCIFKDYDLAERYYRKAIDFDPTNQSIVDNFNDFQENRLPGGRYSGGGPGAMVQKRSIELDWNGEWVFMQDPEAMHQGFSKFWFNKATQKTQWQEPTWSLEWISRKKRGALVNERDGWSQYYDSVSNAYFYYNHEKSSGTWECPPYLLTVFSQT